jgi:Ca2+-transporting ATPase
MTAARPEGLSTAEARARLARVGPNVLVARDRWAFLREVASIVADPMAIMLAVAATAYLALGETKDGVILLAAIAPVLAVDVLLEARSRKALAALARSVRPLVMVVRGGAEREIPSEELVPGDAVVLREGDVLHADGVVRFGNNLSFDESQLTGESEPQIKEAHEGDAGAAPPAARVWAGSLVLGGTGWGEVTTTGAATRFGEIARLVAQARSAETPLQRRIGRVARWLGGGAVLVALGVFALGWSRGAGPWQALLTAVSVAISAVPEEFPLVFTLFLSMGAFRLSRRGVLVRRLASVETLGSTTVVCTDKTGTLTEGHFAVDAHVPLAPGEDDDALLVAAVLACEPAPSDPMEKAIVADAAAHGVDVAALQASHRLLRDHDFDPVGKHMSHVWEGPGGRARVLAKGALEGVLDHCEVSPEDRARIEAAHERLAAAGMRVLAVAAREVAPTDGTTRADDERALVPIGLIGFRDPLRPEVPGAVRECCEAGIRIKLVTGDHVLTAHAIADAAGIPHGDDGIVTGPELDALAPEARAARIERCAIFARIRPEQKHEIVDVLSRAGEVVAMTGDGINDAPALRRADIGVSLGRRGTAVARAAADLVLLDDDFASIVRAAREGRAIYINIQRAFLFLLGFKLRIVLLALGAPLLGFPALFLPVHLVWLELIVHPVSALAFEGEPPPADLMRRPPRDPRAPLVAPPLAARALLSGFVLAIGAFWAYAAHLGEGVRYARSLGVAVVIAGSLLLVFAERALDVPLHRMPLPRSARFWVVWLGVAASLPLFMHLPAIAAIFEIQPLRLDDWGVVLAVSVASIGWRVLPIWTPRAPRSA